MATKTKKELFTLLRTYYQIDDIWKMALIYKQLLALYPESIVELNKKRENGDPIKWGQLDVTLVIMNMDDI